MKKLEKDIAKELLKIGAVFLQPNNPFTWASGIKSPIYCDNRLTLSYPKVRELIEESLVKIIKKYYPEVEILMGTSTAGIAHAGITAHLLGLPMGYVRGQSKSHGRVNRIEGHLPKGVKVVIIEDLISTGGSCIDVAEALRGEGAEVLGVASIFTYGMQKGLEQLAEKNLKNISLSNIDVLTDVAVNEGYISLSDKNKILKFRDCPTDESWAKSE